MPARSPIGFVALVLLASCRPDPAPPWITSNLESEIRLIPDTPEVRLLISAEEKLDAPEIRWLKGSQPHDERVSGVNERRQHPERYAPTLKQFTTAMESKRNISVPGGTLCRVVERSDARCTALPLDTFAYVKIRIIEGPKRGQEGWVCELRDVFGTTSAKIF